MYPCGLQRSAATTGIRIDAHLPGALHPANSLGGLECPVPNDPCVQANLCCQLCNLLGIRRRVRH